jgi:photosystem II stability/assembly factor-like uncharacterized protein
MVRAAGRYRVLQRKYLVGSLAVLTFPWVFASSQAGINSFTSVGPDGGEIRKVVFHPTNPAIAYAASSNDLYRSTDGGVTWMVSSCSHGDFIRDFVVDPNNGDRVFVGTVNTIVSVSTDAGVTCKGMSGLPSSADPNPASSLELSRDGVLYAVAQGSLLRTIGTGTWEKRTLPAQAIFVLRVDPLDSNALFTITDQGGFRSTDGGASWDAITLPVHTSDLAIPAGSPQKIFAAAEAGIMVSIDGGANWSVVGPDAVTEKFALDPTNPQVLYASTYPADLLRSGNGGGTWESIYHNARTGHINSIAVNPITPNIVLIGGSEGLVRTTNSGGAWTSVNEGIVATSVERIVAAPVSKRIYFYTNSSGIFALDQGSTWAHIVNPNGLAAVTPSNSLGFFSMAAGGESVDEVLAGTNGGFARSKDGGDHWEWVSAPAGAIDHISVSPKNHDDILIAGTGGISRSTDSGAHWSSVAGLPPGAVISAFGRASDCTCTVYAGVFTWSNGSTGTAVPLGIYKTTDGGADWIAVGGSMPLGYVTSIQVDPRTDQTIYVTAQDNSFKTVDGGASWTALSLGLPYVGNVSIDELRPDTIYAVSNGRVARSVDAGATSQIIFTPQQFAQNVGIVIRDPFEKYSLIASRASGGVAEMTVATDLDLQVDVSSLPPEGAQSITYKVRNLGPVHATDLRTVIQLPASATGTTVSTTSGACSVDSVTVTCTKPVFLAGDELQITVNTAISEKDSSQIVAVTESSEFDPETSNNTAHTTITAPSADVSDLAVSATGPTSVTEGRDFNYSFVVTNAGPDTASAPTATIQLGSGLTAASVASTVGRCEINGSVITCAIDDLAVDATATMTVQVAAATRGTYTTKIKVQTASEDTVSNNDSAAVTTTVDAPSSDTVGTPSSPGSTGSGGSGTPKSGGGGGSNSWWFVAALLSLALRRRRIPGV